MSNRVGVDINRILFQNSQLQQEIQVYHHKYREAAHQLKVLGDALQSAKVQREDFYRRKEAQTDQIIHEQKQFYDREVNKLVQEKQQLIKNIDSCHDQIASLLFLKSIIQQLKEKLENAEETNKKITQNFTSFKAQSKLQSDFKSQEALNNLKQSQNEKAEIINQLQINIKALIRSEESSKIKIQGLQSLVSSLQASLTVEKQRVGEKNKELQIIRNKIPQDILAQIIHLRKQNADLRKVGEEENLHTFQKDGDEMFLMLQKFHLELAALRYELNQVKNQKDQTTNLLFKQRAQNNLNSLKFQKQLDFYVQENKQLKTKKLQHEDLVNTVRRDQRAIQELVEQRNILQTRVFVLQAMKIGQKYRYKDQSKFSQFQQRINLLVNRENKEIESLQAAKYIQNIVSLYQIIKTMDERLVKVQEQRQINIKRYKNYKERFQLLSSNFKDLQHQYMISLDQTKIKITNYDKLVQKLQFELQKSMRINIDVTQKNNFNILLIPYEQKIQSLTTENIVLVNQSKNYEVQNQKVAQKYEDDIRRLKIQIQIASKQNYQLMKKLRNSQSAILKQELGQSTSRTSRNYQLQAIEKGQTVLKLQTALRQITQKHQNQSQVLRNHYEKEKNHLEKQIELLKVENSTLMKSSNLIGQSNSDQIVEMKARLSAFSTLLENYHGQDKGSQLIVIYNQLNSAKQELYQQKNQTTRLREKNNGYIKKIGALERQLQGFRGRLTEMEDLSKKLTQQVQDKNYEILRLSELESLKRIQINKLVEKLQNNSQSANASIQLQLFDHHTDLREDYNALLVQNSSLQTNLRDRDSKLELLRNEYDRLYDQNLQLLYAINEHNIQNKEKIQLNEKYQSENQRKINYLQSQHNQIVIEHQILKQQANQLRRQLLQKNQQMPSYLHDNSSRIDQYSYKLDQKDKQLLYYRQQLDKITNQRFTQKELFLAQWNEINEELQECKRRLEERVISFNPSTSFSFQITALRNKIQDLQGELQRKQEVIYNNQREIFNLRLDTPRAGIADIHDLVDLRQQVQRLMELKYVNEDKIRTLQQENSLLKVRRISEPIYEETNIKNLNELLRDRQGLLQDMNLRFVSSEDLGKRYEQALGLLVLAWSEVQSLRSRVEAAEGEAQQAWGRHMKFMTAIENLGSSGGGDDARVELIRELECGHQHLMQFAERNRFSVMERVSVSNEGIDNFGSDSNAISRTQLILIGASSSNAESQYLINAV